MEHLRRHNETYFSHLKFALWLSLNSLFASVILFIHAFIPPLFEYTGGYAIHEMSGELLNRKKQREFKSQFCIDNGGLVPSICWVALIISLTALLFLILLVVL